MDNNFTVFSTDDIKTALAKININCKGAVVVVDESNCLIRLLTDGDIRRAFLDKFDINSKISLLHIDHAPVSAPIGLGFQAALSLMDEKEIDHLVMVKDDGIVVDLFHRKDITPILLSIPHMGDNELKYVSEAFSTNWIAPLGPNVDGFENELNAITGAKHSAALSSGTAAIHLSLILLDVKPNDIILCSSLTFAASANPILYQHATPVFIDSEPETWNMSPLALEKALVYFSEMGTKPKAMIVVNLYGQSADMDMISALSDKFDVPIVEDAAESLGASYKGRQSGTFGLFGVYSFNGNKIITTSGGGMLVSDNKELIDKARFLATQARDPAPYYQHTEIGYNYRMSNVLAGIGRGQLNVLSERVNARRVVFERYKKSLLDIECLDWMPEPEGYYSNRWLTAVVLNPLKTNVKVAEFIAFLRQHNIEARHVWKPMHLQPVFSCYKYFSHDDNSICNYLFEYGVCLPSSSSMSENEQLRVISVIRKMFSK